MFVSKARLVSLLGLVPFSLGQSSSDALGLSDGYLSFSTENWDLELVKDAQVLASLKPTTLSSFDFSPFDVLSDRAANGQYHMGDLTFRYRTEGGSSWTSGDTALKRATVTNVSVSDSGAFVASDLAPTLSGITDLSIIREWKELDGDLAVVYSITNNADDTLELGSLGFPVEFNNIFTNREASEVEEVCSLQDPYIGLDAGYVQVTRVNGTGPALVVSPLNETKFEAWRFLDESNKGAPLYYQSQVFEALYEFQVYTTAYAENEWSGVTPWNEPTSRMLAAGETLTVGLRFSLASGGVSDIASTVAAAGVPHAQSVPGYIIPQDVDSTLTLDTTATVSNMTTDPAGALEISQVSDLVYTVSPASSAYGRVRLTINYDDGRQQTIHYNVVKSAPTVLSDLGNFLTTSQYYTDTSDPFGRAPSVISYDRSVNDYVLQDNRVWIAGLSDEAGAGSFLAATMKQAYQPNADELSLLEDFIQQVMWGVVQVNDGSSDEYAVRKSAFYYGLSGYDYDSSINWSGAWTKSEAYSTSRAYDYVHVSAAYWALYRAARDFPDLVTQQTWEWYLNQAYETVMKCTARDSSGNVLVGYADDGLMGETVWGEILKDLDREGLTNETTLYEAAMQARAENWNSLAVPFGSEMAWDSTGQEG